MLQEDEGFFNDQQQPLSPNTTTTTTTNNKKKIHTLTLTYNMNMNMKRSMWTIPTTYLKDKNTQKGSEVKEKDGIFLSKWVSNYSCWCQAILEKKDLSIFVWIYCQGYFPKHSSLRVLDTQEVRTQMILSGEMRVTDERGDSIKVDGFWNCCRYQRGETYDDIEADKLEPQAKAVEDSTSANRLFYFAIPPEQFAPVPAPLPSSPIK